MSTVARIIGVVVLAMLLQPATALAHCDALDGPVVRAARSALAARDVTPVLRWVRPADEAEVKAAFDRTLEAPGATMGRGVTPFALDAFRGRRFGGDVELASQLLATDDRDAQDAAH